MDEEELERLRQQSQAIFDSILPPQPKSDKWKRRGHGLVILKPLEEPDIEVLLDAPNLRTLSVERMPPVRTWELLNDPLFVRRPDILLNIGSMPMSRRNEDFVSLDFLDHLPNVRDLTLGSFRIKDVTGLCRHPGLHDLCLVGRISKRVTLDFLSSHPGLRRLGMDGFGFVPKGLERITQLVELERFYTGLGFPSLSFLVPLPNLREIALALGANHDMDSLGRIESLERLYLVRVRMLSDLSGLGGCRSLKKLKLEDLRNVKGASCAAQIPTLEDLSLTNLKGFVTFDGIAGHPTLRKLVVHSCPRLGDGEWLRLGACPRLEELLGVIPDSVRSRLQAALPACRLSPPIYRGPLI